MSCTKHFLTLEWEHHDWDRRVTHTKYHAFRGTDMWSRAVPVDQVICHTHYVCRTCGAVRDGTDCGCDKAIGEACPARLALLDEVH